MKLKRVIGIAAATLGAAFAVTSIVAIKKKKDSQYENDPSQKNPMEGKKVIFVEDENDKENADGLKGHLEAVGDSEHKAGVYEKYIKRGVDIILSFGGLVVLSPVLLGIAVAIKIDDPGPVLFTQKRVGENKKYFKLHKFRSMKMSTPHDKPTHMLENPEQYITKVGKFIRAHSLDELPQIWDIFIGNMSVIGPRPGLWNQDFLTAERDKYGANDIKPGLTGWAQINGRDEIEIPVKAKLDGEYAQKMGLAMDAKVFLGSLHVFGGDDSVVEGGTGEMKKAAEEMIIPDDIKVSVVMATYKRDEALRNALLSLTKQTFKNFEVVLVDDNDNQEWTSKVQAIVDEVSADIEINYIVNEHNMGSAATRNVGIYAAKGQYITFLDDDDVYLPKKIENQLGFMVDKNADFCLTDLFLYNENDIQTDKRVRSFLQEYDKKSLLKYHLMYHLTGTDTLMFKTDFLQEIGGFPPIDVGDEFYLVLRAIENDCKLVYLPGCDVKAYVHGENGGISTGENKIKGENSLYEKKKQYFNQVDDKAVRFVKMRHYAVLAVANKTSGNYVELCVNLFKSFVATPSGFVKLLISHKG